MPSPSDYAATSRAAARSILGRPPFTSAPAHRGLAARILHDVDHWIGSGLHWIGRQFGHYFGHPVAHGAHAAFGGGSHLVLDLGAVLIAAGVAWAIAVVLRGRSHPVDELAAEHRGSTRARRAATLLDEARRAWERGDLDTALRLRFEAGLEGLEDRGVVQGRAALTTSEVSRRLGSPTFDELASVHANVAYGGAPATDDEVTSAFERWPDVLEPPRARAGTPS